MNRGENLLDPWIGSATGPIQARLLGINGIGIDVDPVACLISRVSLASYDTQQLDDLLSKVNHELDFIEAELPSIDMAQDLFSPGSIFSLKGLEGRIPPNDSIEFWFAPVQRAVLALLVAVSMRINDFRYRAIVELAISASIIHKWPNTISLAMDIDHSRPHRVLRKNITVSSQTKVFRRVVGDIVRDLKAINDSRHGSHPSWEIIEGDTKASLNGVAPNSIDYILTSPPYFNAIDYPRSHKFSQWWLWPDRTPLTKASYLGLMPGLKDNEAVAECRSIASKHHLEIDALLDVSPAIHRSLCKYIVELNGVVTQFKRLLRKGGQATFVIGNNLIQGHTVPTSQILAAMLENAGLIDLRIEPRAIKTNRRRYPFGDGGFTGPMESEFIVHASKP